MKKTIADINIYKDEETGRYYVEFINLGIDEVSLCRPGLWIEKCITKKKAISLIRYLCNKEDVE